MPSIRYINQSAPFWDFVAGLEDQGTNHPFFAAHTSEGGHPGWTGPPHHGWRLWQQRQEQAAQPGPSNTEKDTARESDGETLAPEGDSSAAKEKSSETTPEGAQNPEHPRCGRRGGWGRNGWGGRRGGRHGWGRGGPWGGPGAFSVGAGPFGLGQFAEIFNSQLFGGEQGEKSQDDFTPDADVFDTETEYVIHVSLPGANRNDIGVNWDADKSELSIAGVVHRPGDEEFLKTLALNERKVGPFERKIRLGTRANPAQVDVDGITAKLEDGILRIEVPKKDKDDFVRVQKVDIE
ncbi:HSP20-like chaperone [Eremomyces bilateralis CBS 781.70]|uniref:HSP20-like chaperone n=1 Tax=Eremomyces bilateralis CBS 781.70 TaxID=1392243 RepID=A0A6G1FV16_9PEZI|nr:HSP20-like chaperone [Eremomyces bilateralis CBS 781.70]KAF1809548.1 HSP20-like chaperone [Eremomyces bilateralis CBS 781.70]